MSSTPIEKMWGGALKQQVIDSGATLVVRPDSGNPPDVVEKCARLLDATFGSTINGKGYKVLNHVRLIQGDGVNPDSIREILERLKHRPGSRPTTSRSAWAARCCRSWIATRRSSR